MKRLPKKDVDAVLGGILVAAAGYVWINAWAAIRGDPWGKR